MVVVLDGGGVGGCGVGSGGVGDGTGEFLRLALELSFKCY